MAVDAALATVLEGAYTEELAAAEFSISPPDDMRLVAVRFRLTATRPNPQAVDEFAKRLEEMDATLPDASQWKARPLFRFELPDSNREKLTGEYQVFDMRRVFLVDATGGRHKPKWAIAPSAENSLRLGGGWQWISGSDPDHWHMTAKSDGCFAGLVDVGSPVEVSLLWVLAKDIDVGATELAVEGCAPVPVEVAGHLLPKDGVAAAEGGEPARRK